jgi:hypothetical protein
MELYLIGQNFPKYPKVVSKKPPSMKQNFEQNKDKSDLVHSLGL